MPREDCITNSTTASSGGRHSPPQATLLIGLDIGTTRIKAVCYDTELGRVVSTTSRPTPVHHPAPGWSEHDPDELWQTIASCLREVAADHPVAGLGVSSFAEAGLPLDAAGQPLYPIIAWYDRRPEPQAAWWETQLSADRDGFNMERTVISEYRTALEGRWKEVLGELSRLYRANKQLVSRMSSQDDDSAVRPDGRNLSSRGGARR